MSEFAIRISIDASGLLWYVYIHHYKTCVSVFGIPLNISSVNVKNVRKNKLRNLSITNILFDCENNIYVKINIYN